MWGSDLGHWFCRSRAHVLHVHHRRGRADGRLRARRRVRSPRSPASAGPDIWPVIGICVAARTWISRRCATGTSAPITTPRSLAPSVTPCRYEKRRNILGERTSRYGKPCPPPLHAARAACSDTGVTWLGVVIVFSAAAKFDQPPEAGDDKNRMKQANIRHSPREVDQQMTSRTPYSRSLPGEPHPYLTDAAAIRSAMTAAACCGGTKAR